MFSSCGYVVYISMTAGDQKNFTLLQYDIYNSKCAAVLKIYLEKCSAVVLYMTFGFDSEETRSDDLSVIGDVQLKHCSSPSLQLAVSWNNPSVSCQSAGSDEGSRLIDFTDHHCPFIIIDSRFTH